MQNLCRAKVLFVFFIPCVYRFGYVRLFVGLEEQFIICLIGRTSGRLSAAHLLTTSTADLLYEWLFVRVAACSTVRRYD